MDGEYELRQGTGGVRARSVPRAAAFRGFQGLSGASHFQEGPQNRGPALGADALGVELHAEDVGVLGVVHRLHDLMST